MPHTVCARHWRLFIVHCSCNNGYGGPWSITTSAGYRVARTRCLTDTGVSRSDACTDRTDTFARLGDRTEDGGARREAEQDDRASRGTGAKVRRAEERGTACQGGCMSIRLSTWFSYCSSICIFILYTTIMPVPLPMSLRKTHWSRNLTSTRHMARCHRVLPVKSG